MTTNDKCEFCFKDLNGVKHRVYEHDDNNEVHVCDGCVVSIGLEGFEPIYVITENGDEIEEWQDVHTCDFCGRETCEEDEGGLMDDGRSCCTTCMQELNVDQCGSCSYLFNVDVLKDGECPECQADE